MLICVRLCDDSGPRDAAVPERARDIDATLVKVVFLLKVYLRSTEGLIQVFGDC